MKKFVIITVLMAAIAAGSALKAQDSQQEYIGLPGDNLNLYAVMRLFQESKTLEDFERNLNDQNSNINNLDLNGDNLVDYIKVFDDVDGDVHNIVLQDAVSPRENQDIAVFTVQRFQNGQVQIQLTGDEDLYGRNYIIEPIYDDANQGETPNPGYANNSRSVNGVTVTYVRTTPVQIATWPLVRYIFLPNYRVWHSNWYWGYYPSYWHPWRPFSWNYYYGYQYNWNNVYYSHYRRWDQHRYNRWNDFYYTGRRSYSSDVKHRIVEGNYKSTYSHPDQRREGEAMFAKSHPRQYRSSGNISTSNSSSATRRQTSTMRKNQSNGNNGSTTRRSGNTITNQSATHPSNGNNTSTTRRSGNTITNQSATHPSNGNNTSTTRRSSTSVTNRSVTNTSSGQNASDKNTKVRSNTTKTNSSAKMSKNKTKSSGAAKKSSASKEKDKKDPIRK